ncbi:MAG: hypothetical protein LBC59_02975 [Chitinispirillales bacterium]|nr:hypothetical protein [Chitinispirillales bacterium]
MDAIIEVVLFLLLFVGGIVVDIVKKNRAKRVEEEIERASRAPTARNTYQSNDTIVTPPQKKAAGKKTTVKPNAVRAEEAEWLATIAERKRKEALKAAEKLPPFEDTVDEPPASPEQQSTAAFTLSVQQARAGIVLAEILGPPVSLK